MAVASSRTVPFVPWKLKAVLLLVLLTIFINLSLTPGTTAVPFLTRTGEVKYMSISKYNENRLCGMRNRKDSEASAESNVKEEVIYHGEDEPESLHYPMPDEIADTKANIVKRRHPPTWQAPLVPTYPEALKVYEKETPNLVFPHPVVSTSRIPRPLGRPVYTNLRYRQYQTAMLAWGPSYVLLVTMASQSLGSYEHTLYYFPLFLGNASSIFQPTITRYSRAGVAVRIKKRIYVYPGLPCPFWLRINAFCLLTGQGMQTFSWQKFSDYSVRQYYWNVDSNYSKDLMEVMIPPIINYYHPEMYNLRNFQCDPTLDCPAFPTRETQELPFDWSTTPTPTAEDITSTPPPEKHKTPPSTGPTEPTESWRMRDLRWIARMLWPVLFVLCLIVIFFVLPLLYITAKRKAEREALERWYRVSSSDGRVHFLIQVPPAWPPGWPPGPREPVASRSYKEPGEGEAEEPPAKRPRR